MADNEDGKNIIIVHSMIISEMNIINSTNLKIKFVDVIFLLMISVKLVSTSSIIQLLLILRRRHVMAALQTRSLEHGERNNTSDDKRGLTSSDERECSNLIHFGYASHKPAQLRAVHLTAAVRRYCNPELDLNMDYYAHFYRKAGADAIFQTLQEQLEPFFAAASNAVKMAGRLVSVPRRQTAFGDLELSYSFSGITLQANPWIPLVSSLRDHVQKATGENYNFVLVNHYRDGKDHVGEHRDNEPDLVPTASIASLSFGQQRDFVLRHKDIRGRGGKGRGCGGGKGRVGGGKGSGGVGMGRVNMRVVVELSHGSLLVMKYPTNQEWYHSLPIRRTALHSRLNLTFRTLATRQ